MLNESRDQYTHNNDLQDRGADLPRGNINHSTN